MHDEPATPAGADPDPTLGDDSNATAAPRRADNNTAAPRRADNDTAGGSPARPAA